MKRLIWFMPAWFHTALFKLTGRALVKTSGGKLFWADDVSPLGLER